MKVALKGCAQYDENLIENALKESINLLGGIDKFISRGQKVLIKPNMLAAALPEEAVCTHPLIVHAVIKLVQEAGGQPYVGDSPAIGSAQKVAVKNGIAQVCKNMNVEIMEFNQPVEKIFVEGLICKRFVIDKAVIEADVIISIPKLKTHGLTFFTGGIKNLYGCITGKQKAQFHLRMPDHNDFSNMLVDLYCLIKPNLTIMDGIIGMEGAGPRNGRPRNIGVILASSSAVALDVVATSLIGVKPLDIPTLKAAISHGVDIKDISDIKILGDNIDDFKLTDFAQSSAFSSIRRLPKPVISFFQNHLTAKPIIKEKCIGCGVCKESCPPQIIEITDKKAKISYDKCIRCYCCQELCPHNAIELKKGSLGKLLFK